MLQHSSPVQSWKKNRTTRHSCKHIAVSNWQKGWQKNTRKIHRESACPRRCWYFDTQQISLQKGRARQSLGWFYQPWLWANDQALCIYWTHTSWFYISKTLSWRAFRAPAPGVSKFKYIYINQSSRPYNHSAIGIIPVCLSSDLMTHETWITGCQYGNLSYISLWWEKDLDFHIMRVKTATGACKICQISTSLLSGISWCCLFKFPGHLLDCFAFSPRCQHTSF